jgi:hypothetical protein
METAKSLQTNYLRPLRLRIGVNVMAVAGEHDAMILLTAELLENANIHMTNPQDGLAQVASLAALGPIIHTTTCQMNANGQLQVNVQANHAKEHTQELQGNVHPQNQLQVYQATPWKVN